MTLTEFLLARIAEDETVAQGHEGTGYQRWPYRPYGDRLGGTVGPEHVPIAEDWRDRGYVAVAEHISRHDPARVLAECEASRHIVARAQALADWDEMGSSIADDGDFILSWLAAPYADHPDYREEWRP
jgi:hypothetical protein